VGDQLAAGSVELRVPVTSPLRLGLMGFSVFGDAGTVYGQDDRLRDARFRFGVGAGWYLRAPLVHLQVDVAHGIDRGTRAHVTAGLRF
jgi:outer membrane protein assembly factor BamA